MDYILWLEVGLFVCMMGFSGFFSSSETALFSLSNTQIEQMRRDQHPRFGLIQRLLSQPRRLIITILIGNELVNVTASVISAAVVIRVLGTGKAFPAYRYLFLRMLLLRLLSCDIAIGSSLSQARGINNGKRQCCLLHMENSSTSSCRLSGT